MTAYHLRKDEVEYELKIRGVDFTGVAGELRKRLAQCFSSNSKVNEEIVKNLDPESEFEECGEKFEDLASLVEEYDGNGKDREFQRLHARLSHLYVRVERIPSTSDEEVELKKSDLLVKTKGLIDLLEKTNKTPIEQLLKEEVPQNLDLASVSQTKEPAVHGVVQDNPREPVVSKPTSVNAGGPQHSSPSSYGPVHKVDDYSGSTARYSGIKSIPVYKWGIKFDIESGQSVGSFLERVEELRRARGLSQQELFDSAVDLFSGTALIWYRSVVSRVFSWEQLCQELKLVFQSPDYDDMLRQEIRNRFQGPEESIDLFLAAIEGLYGRLSVKVCESERLQQVLKNINPYLQEKLCMFDIKTMDMLRELGRKAELGRLRSSKHNQPQRHHRILEPDLAWGTSSARRKFNHLATITTTTPRVSESLMKCWNCSGQGHRFSQCTRERSVFCYGCGSPGVKKASCSNCKSKNLHTRETAK